MSRSLTLMFCLVIGLLVLACSKPAGTSHTVAAGDQIGVPECDSFLNAYEDCVSTKAPEAARPQLQTIMKTWRSDWKRLAENPQTKPGLVEACKRQHEMQRAALNKAYGCTL